MCFLKNGGLRTLTVFAAELRDEENKGGGGGVEGTLKCPPFEGQLTAT